MEGDDAGIEALDREAFDLLAEGQDVAALEVLERALILKSRLYGLNSDEVSRACESLATICNSSAMKYLEQDHYELVYELLKKAEILTDARSSISNAATRLRLRGVTYNNLGCYYRRRGKLHSALQYLDKALKIEVVSPFGENPAGTHLNICATLSQLGKHTAAMEHAQCALQLLLNQVDRQYTPRREQEVVAAHATILAIAFHNLAVEQEHLGLPEALQTYSSAVLAAARYWGPDHPKTLAIQSSLEDAQKKAKRGILKRPFEPPALTVRKKPPNKYRFRPVSKPQQSLRSSASSPLRSPAHRLPPLSPTQGMESGPVHGQQRPLRRPLPHISAQSTTAAEVKDFMDSAHRELDELENVTAALSDRPISRGSGAAAVRAARARQSSIEQQGSANDPPEYGTVDGEGDDDLFWRDAASKSNGGAGPEHAILASSAAELEAREEMLRRIQAIERTIDNLQDRLENASPTSVSPTPAAPPVSRPVGKSQQVASVAPAPPLHLPVEKPSTRTAAQSALSTPTPSTRKVVSGLDVLHQSTGARVIHQGIDVRQFAEDLVSDVVSQKIYHHILNEDLGSADEGDVELEEDELAELEEEAARHAEDEVEAEVSAYLQAADDNDRVSPPKATISDFTRPWLRQFARDYAADLLSSSVFMLAQKWLYESPPSPDASASSKSSSRNSKSDRSPAPPNIEIGVPSTEPASEQLANQIIPEDMPAAEQHASAAPNSAAEQVTGEHASTNREEQELPQSTARSEEW